MAGRINDITGLRNERQASVDTCIRAIRKIVNRQTKTERRRGRLALL
jgi:hypothetical protein